MSGLSVRLALVHKGVIFHAEYVGGICTPYEILVIPSPLSFLSAHGCSRSHYRDTPPTVSATQTSTFTSTAHHVSGLSAVAYFQITSTPLIRQICSFLSVSVTINLKTQSRSTFTRICPPLLVGMSVLKGFCTNNRIPTTSQDTWAGVISGVCLTQKPSK